LLADFPFMGASYRLVCLAAKIFRPPDVIGASM
jgi:hypothetical protein